MEDYSNISRRALLAGAGTFAIGKALGLDAFVAEAAPKLQPKTEDEIKRIHYSVADQIAKIANEPKAGQKPSPIFYRNRYETYEEQLKKARESIEGLSWSDNLFINGKGLEAIALTRQADMLRGAYYNVMVGDEIKINGLGVVKTEAGGLSKVYNLLKALQDYVGVIDIWEEAGKNKKTLPSTLNVGHLGGYGAIESPVIIYRKMNEVLDSLLRISTPLNVPKNYLQFLKRKKSEVEKKLKTFLQG